MKTISKEYFDYATSLRLQYKVSDDPLAQPVSVFTNVENGLGIIGSYNTAYLYVPYPTPKITAIIPSQGRLGDTIRIAGEDLMDGHISYSLIYFLSNADGHFRFSNENNPFPDGLIYSPMLEESTPTSILVRVPPGAKTK